MKLYIAVTPDEYELPLFVTDSVKAMADWANISVKAVYQQCSKNRKKEPRKRNNGGFVIGPYKIRKITIEEDNP